MKRETSPHAMYMEDISKDIFDIITIYDMDLANEVPVIKTNLTKGLLGLGGVQFRAQKVGFPLKRNLNPKLDPSKAQQTFSCF